MAALNLLAPSEAGTAEVFTAASAGGDSFPLGQAIILKLKNASGGAITVTLASQKACNQGLVHAGAAIVVGAGATVAVKVRDIQRFADTNGRLQMTYSTEVGLSVAAYAASA